MMNRGLDRLSQLASKAWVSRLTVDETAEYVESAASLAPWLSSPYAVFSENGLQRSDLGTPLEVLEAARRWSRGGGSEEDKALLSKFSNELASLRPSRTIKVADPSRPEVDLSFGLVKNLPPM